MAQYKVTGIGEHGKFFDDNAYHDAIDYIFRSDKAAHIGGCNVTSSQTAAREMEQTAAAFGKSCGKRVRHSILSFVAREHVSLEEANDYAQAIIGHYAPEYQMVYAVHANTEHPHIHFVMNQISYVDGHRYQGRKKDYYDFLQHMKRVTHVPVIPAK